jgi:hypothetical protein
VLDDRLGVVLGYGVVQGLAPTDGRAEAGLQHPARRLAGPEARDAHLPGQLAERRVDVLFELDLVDLDADLDLVALERLDGCLHKRGSLPVVPTTREPARSSPGGRTAGPDRTNARRCPPWVHPPPCTGTVPEGR